MNNLKLALIQTSLVWENAQANRNQLDKKLTKLDEVDLVLLPEMWSTGFSMKPQELSETMNGESVQWMKGHAVRLNAAVTGSLIIQDGGKYFNRVIWAQPDGVLRHYDKRHRFSYAGEDEEYTAGEDRPTWEWNGWRIRPQICYDLRFPVWSRNDNAYDLLFYVANWPARRSYPWKALLRARAIENMAYVVGVNRVGLDGNNIEYSGDSAVIDSLGATIVEAESGAEDVLMIEIDKGHLEETRSRFGFLNDRDEFKLL